MFKKPADVLAIRYGRGEDAYIRADRAAYEACPGDKETCLVEVFTDDYDQYGEYWATDRPGLAWVEANVDNVGLQVLNSYGYEPGDID
jgi:hypothetical protein